MKQIHTKQRAKAKRKKKTHEDEKQKRIVETVFQ